MIKGGEISESILSSEDLSGGCDSNEDYASPDVRSEFASDTDQGRLSRLGTESNLIINSNSDSYSPNRRIPLQQGKIPIQGFNEQSHSEKANSNTLLKPFKSENDELKLSVKTVPIMEVPNEDSNEDVISGSDSEERSKPIQQHKMFQMKSWFAPD